jgi:hypothetical protein
MRIVTLWVLTKVPIRWLRFRFRRGSNPFWRHHRPSIAFVGIRTIIRIIVGAIRGIVRVTPPVSVTPPKGIAPAPPIRITPPTASVSAAIAMAIGVAVSVSPIIAPSTSSVASAMSTAIPTAMPSVTALDISKLH